METPLISVITPSLNAKTYISQAIESVVSQGYPRFEHIVVDGASADGTVAVLERHAHLRWQSRPDHGQSDAMNRGFGMARGDVIVYLNADDFFEPGAFAAVARLFAAGEQFVVGQVRVLQQGGEFLNDPKTGLGDMLRWWRPDAFCYNSAGYFFRREVLEQVGPFDVDDHFHMDYRFLIEARRLCRFAKVDSVLANFRLLPGTKTFENSPRETMTMRRFDAYADLLDPGERQAFIGEREEHFRRSQAAR